jgi:hypothetical protein
MTDRQKSQERANATHEEFFNHILAWPANRKGREQNRVVHETRSEDGREENVDKPSMMRFLALRKGSLAYMILSVLGIQANFASETATGT